MRGVGPGHRARDIPTHRDSAPPPPPPAVVSQGGRHEAECARLKKLLLLFITVPRCVSAFAMCLTEGLENTIHSRMLLGSDGFHASRSPARRANHVQPLQHVKAVEEQQSLIT